jgi:hypothetical protein
MESVTVGKESGAQATATRVQSSSSSGCSMGPLGKIAAFFKNVPVERNRKRNAVVYGSVGPTCQRRSSEWSSLLLNRGFKGELIAASTHTLF